MAKEISAEFAGTELIALCVLKGAMFFCADLVRQMTMDVALDFIQISSYGNQKYSSGVVTILKEPQLDMRGKSVLIVEDIIDSGLSIREVNNYIESRGAAKVKTAGVPRQAESAQGSVHARLRRLPDRAAVRDRLRPRLRGEVPEHPRSAGALGLELQRERSAIGQNHLHPLRVLLARGMESVAGDERGIVLPREIGVMST